MVVVFAVVINVVVVDFICQFSWAGLVVVVNVVVVVVDVVCQFSWEGRHYMC